MWQLPRGLPITAAMIAVLALAVQAMGATPATPSSYWVSSLSVPGADTGLVLKKGHPVTLTATGTVCPGIGLTCTSPAGNHGFGTTPTDLGGFLQPEAPAHGLLARVGSGKWTHVGNGPIKLSGKGNLVFAFNDNWYPDNVGGFTVTVSYGAAPQEPSGCQPGKGTGDKNHVHTGPPGQGGDACYPGHGYGDKNHTHDGPPGQNDAGPPGQNNGSGGNGKPAR